MKRKTFKKAATLTFAICMLGIVLFSIGCIHQYNLARDGLAHGFDPNGDFTIRLAGGSLEGYTGPSHFKCYGDPEEEGGDSDFTTSSWK